MKESIFKIKIPIKTNTIFQLNGEEFIFIKHNNNYKIGNKGTILNKYDNICKPFINNSGYYCIGLWRNNKKKSYCVHKLVAEHFIKNYNNNLDVDHIDGNKLNNDINNLQLITHKENCVKKEKDVIALTTQDGQIIKKYTSYRKAASDNSIGSETLRKANNNIEIIKIFSTITKKYLYFKNL